MASRARPGRPRRRGLDRYLLQGERIVTRDHYHWAKIGIPAFFLAVGTVLALALDTFLPAGLVLLANPIWWAWIALAGWVFWEFLKWRHDWFVATDKRLILTYGLITEQVGMMPLTKVTDMSYNRSPMARLLGYGTFVMESAGQDQALHKVRWVNRPDHTYRAICAEIFEVEDEDRVPDEVMHDSRFGRGSRKPTSEPYTDFVRPAHGPDQPDQSAGIRVQPAGSQQEGGDSPYPDPTRPPDQGPPAAGSREADTGPIHL